MFHLYIFQYVWGGKELFKKMTTKNFLAVLWSGFHTSTVGVLDWIPDLETKILQAAPEDNPLQTTEASQFITPDKINENFLISNIHCLNYLDCFINSFFQYVQDLNKVYPVWLVDLCLKSLCIVKLVYWYYKIILILEKMIIIIGHFWGMLRDKLSLKTSQ